MSIFREYDIRGIFQKDLYRDVVFSIGKNLAREIKARGGKNVAIGHDARLHCATLYHWLAQGIASEGVKIYLMEMIPAPVAYFCLYNKIDGIELDSSIMITGSHNPPQYNGFKITILKEPFYGEDIKTLQKNVERDIATSAGFQEVIFEVEKIPALEAYIDFISKHFKHLKNFKHKIAVDCGNGVAGLAMKRILQNLHIDCMELYFEPNGNFPNHHPDPSEEKNLADIKNVMERENIPLGIAFDGDADRLALISSNYSLKGDELAILFAKQMAKSGIKPVVIGEVKCSSLMYDEINKIGTSIMYKTGHSNLKVKLKETQAHLACEMSGHIFFNDRYFGYDDAIYSTFRALELFEDSSIESVENIIKNLPKMHSSEEEKIESSEEEKFKIIENLAQRLSNPPSDFPKILDIITIDGLRVVFEHGWGLVRASNTTPVLVTRFEANSKKNLEFYKNALLSLLKD